MKGITKLVNTNITIYTTEYTIGIAGSLPRPLDISSGISNNCPHARNCENTTTILDPMAVPIPLSYAKLLLCVTMAIYCVEIEAYCNHQDTYHYRNNNADYLHVWYFLDIYYY